MTIKLKLTKLTLGTILSFALTGGLIACQPNSNNASSNFEGPGGGETVRSAHSSLLEERFQTEIVNIGMEKLDYKIAPFE
jgi:glycine betaine/proline transport system substrate-binding protein